MHLPERTLSATSPLEPVPDPAIVLPGTLEREFALDAGFRAAIDTMLDAFGVYRAVRDEQGRVVDFRVEYVNDAACRWNRMTRDAQVGQLLCEILPAHRGSELFDQYVRVVETGEPLSRELTFYRDVFGDGQELEVAFDLRATKFGDGFSAAWRDVTPALRARDERERLVAKLQESEALFRTVQDNSPEGCLLYEPVRDPNGKITDFVYRYANAATSKLLGRRPVDDVLGKTLRTVYPASVETGLLDWYADVVVVGAASSRTVRYEHDGIAKSFRITAIPTSDGLAVTFTDVTAAVAAEEGRLRVLDRSAKLLAITSALAGALGPSDVAHVIAAQGGAALGASNAAVALVVPEGEWLDFSGWWGYADDVRAKWPRMPLSLESPLTHAVRSMQPTWIVSREEWARDWPAMVETIIPTTRAWAILPLVAEGRPLGGLALSFNEPQTFDDEQRALTAMVGRGRCGRRSHRARRPCRPSSRRGG